KILLEDIKKSFEKLEIVTSKTHNNKICITRKKEVEKFFKEIKPNNPKHMMKYTTIKNSPVV
ncbi:MAG: hypothetical protein KKC05_00280, partial [Nanoarchaeota archaeon]|nr:hypothetical protein [Nanoarchaeota archaeon]